MEPPRYDGIFQFMVSEYSGLEKQSSRERFFVNDIEENQYTRLVGEPSSFRVIFETPEEASERLEKFVKACGADLYGTCHLSQEMVFKGSDVKGKNVISIGYQMDIGSINTAPDPPAGIEALRAYWRLGWIVMRTAEFIRSMGYNAQGHQVRTFLGDPPTILHSLAAERSGLGEFGRLGFLVTREFGPRVRFGSITTDLPLPDVGSMQFGVEEFCSNCTICADKCAGKAIPYEKSFVRGFEKYTIDPYKCLPEFAKYDGCGICIKVCPFNRTRGRMEWFLEGVQRLRNNP